MDKVKYQFWLAETFGLIRQRRDSESLDHPEVWRDGRWHGGSSYAMDAITGMGEDSYSCGEHAVELNRVEAKKYADSHDIDLYSNVADDE